VTRTGSPESKPQRSRKSVPDKPEFELRRFIERFSQNAVKHVRQQSPESESEIKFAIACAILESLDESKTSRAQKARDYKPALELFRESRARSHTVPAPGAPASSRQIADPQSARQSERERSRTSVPAEINSDLEKFIHRLDASASEKISHLGEGASQREINLSFASATLEAFNDLHTNHFSALDLFERAAALIANPEWSDEKNARRCELIDRKIYGEISRDDAAELNALQLALNAYVNRVAPLPISSAKKMHAKLLGRRKKP
jgi:hypothetical protein